MPRLLLRRLASDAVYADLIPLDELEDRDLQAWREIADRAIEPNPFFEPEMVLPAARWLASGEVALLVAKDVNGWAACLPVHRASRWRKLPLRSLVAWRHQYSFLGTPLIDGTRAYRALATVVERAVRDRVASGFALDWVGDDGAVSTALREVVEDSRLPTTTFESFERAVLRRRPEPSYLEETLSAKRRKELRRLERRLGDDLGAALVVAERGHERGALAEFARLEAEGWKGREGTALASNDRHARFFEELCLGFAGIGRLQLLGLQVAERTVAMQCNLVAGDALFCFKVAYDERLARYSPGLQLELRAVETFHAMSEVAWMDSCAAPDNQLMNGLWPDRRRLASIGIARRGIVGRSWVSGARAGARVRERRRPRPSS